MLWRTIAILFAWSEVKDQDWRSWLMHAAICTIITIVHAGVLPEPAWGGVLVGGWVALWVYGWRELEQIAEYKRNGRKIPHLDCLMDFWAPLMTVSTIVALAFGFPWIGAGCLAMLGGGLGVLYCRKRFVRSGGK